MLAAGFVFTARASMRQKTGMGSTVHPMAPQAHDGLRQAEKGERAANLWPDNAYVASGSTRKLCRSERGLHGEESSKQVSCRCRKRPRRVRCLVRRWETDF